MGQRLSLSSGDLRRLCIQYDWFTGGSNDQYEKLFDALDAHRSIDEIATIIWICSDDCEREEILEILQDFEYDCDNRLPDTYAEIEYADMDSAEAISGARWDDLNYQHYMER